MAKCFRTLACVYTNFTKDINEIVKYCDVAIGALCGLSYINYSDSNCDEITMTFNNRHIEKLKNKH